MSLSRMRELEDENLRLRSRLREFEKHVFAEWVPPAWLPMPRSEIIVLQVLLKHERVSAELLWAALYSRRDEPPLDTSHQSHVSKAKKKLEPFGVEIKSARFLGYWMPDASKAILLSLAESHPEGNQA